MHLRLQYEATSYLGLTAQISELNKNQMTLQPPQYEQNDVVQMIWQMRMDGLILIANKF